MSSKPTAEQWNRIQELFLQLVELPADEQQSQLRKLAGDDDALRSEVSSLLLHDQEKEDQQVKLTDLIHQTMPSLETSDSSDQSMLQDDQKSNYLQQIQRTPGHCVDQFRLTLPLSINRSSEVWKAERLSKQTEQPEDQALAVSEPIEDQDKANTVAIKFLRESLENNNERGRRQLLRFAREAHLLSRFKHPGIAGYVSCGQDVDHSPYIAMQFVDGLPLTRYADQKQLSVDERLRLVIEVTQAVGYAHQFLVVHRDLKPDNILVTDGARPVILDFGISKQLSDTDSDDQQPLDLTTTQFRPMTPAYASPEQVRGDSITTATDVHALGLVLYELVSGHHPFSATANPETNHFHDRICTSVPKKPSEIVGLPADPLEAADDQPTQNPQLLAAQRGGIGSKQLQQKLQGPIDAIVMKALSKEPADRYSSVVELRNDLSSAIAGQPLIAKQEDGFVRSVIRRHPMKTLVGAVVFAGLASLISFWLATKFNNVALMATRSENRELQHELDQLRSPTNVSLLDEAERQLAKFDFPQVRELLVQIDPSEVLELPDLVRVATLWQQLGRPTTATEALGNFQTFRTRSPKVIYEAFDDPIVAQSLLTRIASDAGLHERASKLTEHKIVDTEQNEYDFSDNATRMLLFAKVRLRIGWEDKRLIDPIVQQPLNFDISSEDRLDLKLIQARLKLRDEAPEKYSKSSVANGIQRIGRSPVRSAGGLAIVAEALLLNANQLNEEGELKAAKSGYRDVVSRLESAGLSDHTMVIKALYKLSELAQKNGDDQKAQEMLDRCWRLIENTSEYGTGVACETAIARMRSSAATPDRVYEVVEQMEPWSAVYLNNAYLHRWFLRFRGEAAIVKRDWATAYYDFKELASIDDVLWRDDKLNAAYAYAAAAFVTQHDFTLRKGISELEPVGGYSGPPRPKKTIHELRDDRSIFFAEKSSAYIRSVLEKQNDNLAAVFLAAVCNSPDVFENRNEYEWIHRYMMHYDNNFGTKYEMAVFDLERAATENLPAAKAMLQFLFERDDVFRETAGENAWRTLRLLEVARELGHGEEYVTEQLKRLTESNDSDIAKRVDELLAK